ncbi:MAG TPA: ribosome recycling factor [Aggregatilinea sp.]|uniref:ribosome recycling factor n=1 Tax=Aggregatilinea sp. TaxID=2806333 RepID=UPI002C8CD0D7|nr:ribosome recycling factor [Aggregatilinea sp.]HML25060.1 ribosome recycling factor [Aggregatilinea sp.]
MKSTVLVLEEDLKAMRTGRASGALVEKLQVDYYGVATPLMQLASISVPEPQTIAIRPYDKSTLKAIERAIQASELGLTPNNDGQIIRLNIPALTQERRNDLQKLVQRRVEEARVSVRNIRRSAIEDVREFEKEKMVSEDEAKRGQENVQKLTDKYVEEVETAGKRKEAEIMEV